MSARSRKLDIGQTAQKNLATWRLGSEDHTRLLIGELRHRSKNQFAVLQGIVKFTAKHSADLEDFTARFLPRLRSLSESLELFDIEQGQGVDIEKLAEAQIRSFDDVRRKRITAHSPSLRIASQAAQGLGLALHELGTNAAKYGALSSDPGRIEIGWTHWSLSPECARKPAALLKMVLLAPDVVEAIVEGRADDRVMLKVLERTLPVDWDEQREALGI